MASQGPNGPSGASDQSPGPGNDALGGWLNQGNILAEDGAYANTVNTPGSAVQDLACELIKGGTIGGTNKAVGTALSTAGFTYITYGANNDLWGNTLTPTDINASTFGVAWACVSAGGSGSLWLKATSFGFTIPAGATIDGVVAEVKCASTGNQPQVDYIRMTVYYTAASGGRISRVCSLEGLGGAGQKAFYPSLAGV